MTDYVSFFWGFNIIISITFVVNTFFNFPFLKNWKFYVFVVSLPIIVILSKYSFIDIIVLNIIALFICLYSVNKEQKQIIYQSKNHYPKSIIQVLFGALWFCWNGDKKAIFLWGCGSAVVTIMIFWFRQETPNLWITLFSGISFMLPLLSIIHGAAFWAGADPWKDKSK